MYSTEVTAHIADFVTMETKGLPYSIRVEACITMHSTIPNNAGANIALR